MNIWPLLAVLGAVSLGLRSVLVLSAGRFPLPERAMYWCTLLGPAIIAALLGGSVATSVSAGVALVELAPLAVGAAVAVRFRSTGAALGAGLGAHSLVLLLG